MSDFGTPMMQQYKSIKDRYGDCIVLFRLGDFYEMFLDDAKIGANILNITLTSRDRGKDGRIPMAGIPFHAVDAYLPKLVRAGYKVAIAEQLSDPKEPGLVEREVIRVVTPGTILNEGSLEKKENNYIIGMHVEGNLLGLAVADVSTGFFQANEYPRKDIINVLVNELAKFGPSECVLPSTLYNNPDVLKAIRLNRDTSIFPYFEWDGFANNAKEFLEKHFGVKEIASFGIEDLSVAQKASAGLLGYLKYTQKDKISHIRKISTFDNNDYLILDRSTLINLEIFSTLRENKKHGSFVNYIDKTTTSMGGRLIRQWILKPLTKKENIEKRYEAVSEFLEKYNERISLKEKLGEICDIERVTSRLAAGIGNPKDLIMLKESLKKVGDIRDNLDEYKSPLLKNIQKRISKEALNISGYIDVMINEEPPFDPKSGGLIKSGVSLDLDDLRKKIDKSKNYISKLESTERKNTGISSLKVKFNQVFGYYIEITKSNLHLVPSNFIRKQTLVNAERFITPELKEHEEIILTADEKVKEIEYQKFLEVVENILEKTDDIQLLAHAVAELDCLINFADLAQEKNYCKPVLVTTGEIDIKNGRHPVVESVINAGSFVPNDTFLNDKNHQLLVITGPNMAGKSVYIRQVALIVLMAQMGSFVPAESAKISIADRIFVRSGASDVISMGLSTFMVEMVETANILNNATSKSLIVMDEIGRGTSTYDGISIAWSVAEYLVANGKVSPKTLFATHYHELQDLENKYPDKIKNYQVLVEENGDEPVFLHKVAKGGADHSFGIAVAKMAGVPKDVCSRAEKILEELHLRSLENGKDEKKKSAKQNNKDMIVTNQVVKLDESALLSDKLNNLDISQTTPLEALNILAELKRFWDVQNY